MSRVLAAHQPNFLPWLGLFHKVGQADVWVLADDVQYSRGSLTNRNRIRTADGWQWLTVPVLDAGPGPAADMRCADSRPTAIGGASTAKPCAGTTGTRPFSTSMLQI